MSPLSRSLSIPVVATALVLGGGLAVAAVSAREDAPEPTPTAADQSTAWVSYSEEGPDSSRTAADMAPTGDEPAGMCNHSSELRRGLPRGATVYHHVSAIYEDSAQRPAARRAVANAARIAPTAVECIDFAALGEPEPVEPLLPDGDVAVASREETEVAVENHEGFGSCHREYEPQNDLPDSVTLSALVQGNYVQRSDGEAVRAAMARASGQAPGSIECEFVVPPIGHCSIEITPRDDAPVPDGAQASGFVSGEYTHADQLPALKAALAAMAGVSVDQIECEEDLGYPVGPGPGVAVEQPLTLPDDPGEPVSP